MNENTKTRFEAKLTTTIFDRTEKL